MGIANQYLVPVMRLEVHDLYQDLEIAKLGANCVQAEFVAYECVLAYHLVLPDLSPVILAVIQ